MTTRGLKKKLSNPFVLAAQGFAMGSILVWATIPADAKAQVAVQAPETVSTLAR